MIRFQNYEKSILNLAGAQELSKAEQKVINGGRIRCGGTALIPTPFGDPCDIGCEYETSTYFIPAFPLVVVNLNLFFRSNLHLAFFN